MLNALLLVTLRVASNDQLATTLDLGGSWMVKNSTMHGPVPATVPGQIHTGTPGRNEAIRFVYACQHKKKVERFACSLSLSRTLSLSHTRAHIRSLALTLALSLTL